MSREELVLTTVDATIVGEVVCVCAPMDDETNDVA